MASHVSRLCAYAAFVLTVLSSCLLSGCFNFDYDSTEHAPFYFAFHKVKEKYPDIKLSGKYYEGSGQYFVTYLNDTTDDSPYNTIIEILYEFDSVISSNPECSNLLNRSYISIENNSNQWITIWYHYDLKNKIETNLDKDKVPTIKTFFPDAKIKVAQTTDDNFEWIEY